MKNGKTTPKKIFVWQNELEEFMAHKRTQIQIGVNQDKLPGLLGYVYESDFNDVVNQLQNGCNAINLMHYLDAYRKDGKMCLSNMECVQIEEYWQQGNWAGIINYIRKYLFV